MRCKWWMIPVMVPLGLLSIFLDSAESVKGWMYGP